MGIGDSINPFGLLTAQNDRQVPFGIDYLAALHKHSQGGSSHQSMPIMSGSGSRITLIVLFGSTIFIGMHIPE